MGMNLNIEFAWIVDAVVYWKEYVLKLINLSFEPA